MNSETSPKHLLLGIVAVMILSSALSLLALEAVFRLGRHELFSTRNLILRHLDSSPHEFEYDPTLAWVPVNSKSYTSPPFTSGLPFKITLDEYGFRTNRDFWGTPVRQDFRILTVGDSFTFGSEVSDEETWPVHLQELLKVKVVNGGVPMFGFDQAELRLESSVDRIAPKMVVVSVTPQDVIRTAYSKQIRSVTHRIVDKPYFSIEGDGLKLMNVPVKDNPEKAQLGWFRDVFGRSYLVDFLFRRLAVNWWLSSGKMNSAPPEYKTSFDAVDVSCRILKRINSLGKEKHFVPVILGQVYWQDHSAAYQTDSMVTDVMKCAQEQGLITVELEDEARDIYDHRPEEYDSLFLPWAHMTNRGNLLVARHVATTISNVLKGSSCGSLAKEYSVQLPCER
jgi:hypothetical protein